MEHLLSNTNSINELLKQMANYIRNKKIKANDITDLKEIGEVVWNFITSLYNFNWDTLTAYKKNCSFRQKVTAKFTSQIHKVKKKSVNKEPTDKPASFITISSPIPVKMLKEVNKISKFFKKNNQSKEKSIIKRTYAQALLFSFNVKEILKIKKTFPILQVNKIENI